MQFSGEKLRAARQDRGMTQLELSELAGCSVRTIQRLEAKKYPVSRYFSGVFAEIFDDLAEDAHEAVRL